MGQGPTWTDAQRAARLAKLVERNRASRGGDLLYEDPGWMRAAYVERGLSFREIAVEARCSLRTVARWVTIHGIEVDRGRQPRRLTGADHPWWNGGPPTCEVCGCEVSCRQSVRCVRCRDRSGEKNPKWRGDAVEYPAAHDRVRALRGLATNHECQHCGRPAEQWAYDHADPNERVDSTIGYPYSLDPAHYMPLCCRCHKRFDVSRTN